jgi:cytoskeletal protein CcmA (bactofilin family)
MGGQRNIHHERLFSAPLRARRASQKIWALASLATTDSERKGAPLLLSRGALAHRKMTVALFALLFLLGGALTACSSSGSGALTGTVASIDSAASSFTLTPEQASANATTVTVRVNSGTAFRGALHSLSDLAVGMVVKVQGSAASSAFSATQVEDQDQNDDHGRDGQHDEFKGTAGTIDSATTSFDLTLADGSKRHVTTDAQTEFEGTLHSFADLAVGQRVEVKGAVQADTSILASSVEGDNEENDNNEDAHEIEGTGPVLSVGGNSFVMELSQRQVTVIVSSATDFDGGLHSLADLKVGMQVEIKGALQSNGAIAASQVHGEDNHDGDGHGGDNGGGDQSGGSGGGDGGSSHGGSDDPAGHQ